MTKQYIQSEITFFRNPEFPLDGTTPSSLWKCPGNALSASSARLIAEYPMKIVYARWVLVWNPQAGVTYNAVRLVTADNGPTNLAQIAFLNRNNTSTPVVDAFDLTATLQDIFASGVSKQLLQQTCGDSASKIYGSWIECVYEIDPAA